MQKIVPNLWFNHEAREAASFYISLFDDSQLLSSRVIKNNPSGDSEIVSFQLAGQLLLAISAGPFFKFNPSISLMVACNSIDEVDTKWKALSEGGSELMPLGEYPFSRRYAWIQDRFGLSWQLMLVDNGPPAQKITPCLLFSGQSCGKAEEAIKYYTGIFENSEIGMISRYREGEATSPEARINYGAFKLSGFGLVAMDNGYDVDYGFNEAVSLVVKCSSQNEIDYFWSRLSAVPEAEQCGWLKDQFGVSWQIVPSILEEMMESGDDDKIARLTAAFLTMKKFDLRVLQQAYEGGRF